MNNVIPLAGRERNAGTILLVEPDPLVRSAAAAHLRKAGLSVIEAVSGTEALALLRSGRTIHLACGDLDDTTEIDGTRLALAIQGGFPRVKLLVRRIDDDLPGLERTAKAMLGQRHSS
jgi:CheY-like chemotaxis protein